MSQRIVPKRTIVYLERPKSSVLVAHAKTDPKGAILRVVRVGEGAMDADPPEPMRYEVGQLVVCGPRNVAWPCGRGFLVHQANILAVIEEHDGEDEMREQAQTHVQTLTKEEAEEMLQLDASPLTAN